MQQDTNTANSSGGGFFGGLGGALTDFASAYGQAYLDDKYGESSSEQSEGPAEFANPNTVTQPVYPSQLASGFPVNFNSIATRLGIPVSVLIALTVGALYLFLVRK